MNHILAVCDSEAGYACQLVDYLTTKQSFPFQVQVFTSPQTLEEYAAKKPLAVALVSERDYREEMCRLPISHVIILEEGAGRKIPNLKTLNKYQSIELLVKELLDWVSCEGILGRPVSKGTQMKLIGIYSPIGRCLKTSFSFVLGQLLSKKHKVLYLNLESYSGLGRLLEREFSENLSDLLYYLQNTKDKFAYRMGGMVEQAGGLDYLPPFHSYLDMVSVTGEEWRELLEEIERSSEYEYMILDLSDGIQGLFDILRLCDFVYTITGEDGFAMAKTAQYEEILKKGNYEDVWEKTKKCMLPKFQKLPQGLLQLTYTELAEYARERIREDIDEG
ncbi:MAG: hypothetical protein IJC59_00105 [Lachnospiraceae bacterium]|nr:hypothetical protein [Lachnospiraceae bacterium]